MKSRRFVRSGRIRRDFARRGNTHCAVNDGRKAATTRTACTGDAARPLRFSLETVLLETVLSDSDPVRQRQQSDQGCDCCSVGSCEHQLDCQKVAHADSGHRQHREHHECNTPTNAIPTAPNSSARSGSARWRCRSHTGSIVSALIAEIRSRRTSRRTSAVAIQHVRNGNRNDVTSRSAAALGGASQTGSLSRFRYSMAPITPHTATLISSGITDW